MNKSLQGIIAALLLSASATTAFAQAASFSEGATLPAGTRVYLSLDQMVSSARGEVDVGSLVRCRVWRDVDARGVVFIRGGTPATCRVDKVSRRNMGGVEGKLAIGGVETRTADGQTITLSGGYNKEGSGHKVVVWAVGLLLFWPALFIPGGNAELPPGTVFDTSTVNDISLETKAEPRSTRVVNLTGLGDAYVADFMLDDFIDQPKHEFFHIKISRTGKLPEKIFVDTVNGKPIEPAQLAIKDVKADADGESAVGEIGARSLIKYFAKGINRFTVSYDEAGERHSAEVIMNVQM